MNDKKINKIIITMIGLATFSGALFVYDNFYLNSKDSESVIYVAKQDIPSNATLTKDMFQAMSLPKEGVLSTYVTDLNSVVGKKLKGALLKEEPLSVKRITTEKDLINNLEIKLELDQASMNVSSGEYVNVYVVLNINGDVQVRKVFDTKQVNVKDVKEGDSSSRCVTMKVNEDEVTKYYNAREKGKILVVKNSSTDGKSDITKYDTNSKEAKSVIKETEDKEKEESPTISVISTTFNEGDTLDNLAIKYKTSVDDIKKLNNYKEKFNVGDEIILPAN